jgi:hypothetical protein
MEGMVDRSVGRQIYFKQRKASRFTASKILFFQKATSQSYIPSTALQLHPLFGRPPVPASYHPREIVSNCLRGRLFTRKIVHSIDALIACKKATSQFFLLCSSTILLPIQSLSFSRQVSSSSGLRLSIGGRDVRAWKQRFFVGPSFCQG